MIHYHGTPLTPRTMLYRMAGKHFCVSFSDKRDADICQQIGQSVMFDNGAFSLFTRGAQPDWEKYYEWLEPRLGHPHWAVVPDVIGGAPQDNLDLSNQWPFDRDFGAFVWHLDEPLDQLLEAPQRGWGKICFGSAGAYWQVGSDKWQRRVDEAFNAVARRGPIPWIHMLRGMDCAGARWPFASADSVNVSRNFKDTYVCPEFMARRLDAVQTPTNWTARPQQETLL